MWTWRECQASSPPAACVGLAKPGLHGRLFGTEPALGLRASIAATVGQVIDACMGPGTNSVVGLDFAADRHACFFRKERLARIRRAVRAQQLGGTFVPPAEILGGNEAALPQAGECCSRVFLIHREAPLGLRLQTESPTLAHQPVAKIDARDGALPNPSLWVSRIRADVLAFDRSTRDEIVQFISNPDAARKRLAILVEASLISFQRVDPVKPEGLAIDPN